MCLYYSLLDELAYYDANRRRYYVRVIQKYAKMYLRSLENLKKNEKNTENAKFIDTNV